MFNIEENRYIVILFGGLGVLESDGKVIYKNKFA